MATSPATATDPLPFPAPRPVGSPFDPPSAFTRLQTEQPAARIRLWDGKDAWFFTRYDDVRAVLSDPRFSNDAMDPRFPNETAALQEHRAHQRMLLTMDPPEHTVLRRILARNFVVRRLELMRPNIQSIVDELIDGLAQMDPPADLVSNFAIPLPAMAVSNFLGVPTADRHMFTRLVDSMTEVTADVEQGRAANDAFAAYIDELLTEKEARPTDDVISRLMAEHLTNGTLTRDDVIANVRLILVAAFESTANQVGLGILLMLLHDDQRARLAADPSLADSAVEEVLRYATIDQFGRRRLATADIEVGGQMVRAGDAVVVSQSTANRDASVFPEGDRFDITRDARAHLAFSYGIHQCLGQAVARIELQVAIRTIFERIPTLRLDVPIEEVPFKTDRTLYGVHKLPVTWEPGSIQPPTTPQPSEE